MIDVINLTKKYGDLLVLDDISTTIKEGEKVVIVGPSGGGKSTFLRCLNVLEDPTSGRIMFMGNDLVDLKVDINEQREMIGMVFQQFNLFNNFTVKENITLAPITIGKKAIRQMKLQKVYVPVYNKLIDLFGKKHNATIDQKRKKLEDEIECFENYMPSCRRCNHYKRAHSLEVFRRMIEEIPTKLYRDNYIYKVGLDYNLIESKEHKIRFYFH